ncbi:MAG: hypothetical protein J7498_15935 [Sphingobium sp.]|nr:hypothetical protein [Sphingobium sp.]
MSAPKVVTFANSVPGAQNLADSILHNPSLQELNKTLWLFSLVEISHLLFLVLVGGATLVLALRTLGVTLGDVAIAQVESLTRPWLRVGTLGGVSSGIFLSIATALTLVGNGSFFVKILALGAAVLFGFALGGRLRGGSRAFQIALATIGVALLGEGIWLFASTRILAAGATLLGIVSAIFLALVFVAKRRTSAVQSADPFAQLLAIGTVVAWLTVALGGRWIGFS